MCIRAISTRSLGWRLPSLILFSHWNSEILTWVCWVHSDLQCRESRLIHHFTWWSSWSEALTGVMMKVSLSYSLLSCKHKGLSSAAIVLVFSGLHLTILLIIHSCSWYMSCTQCLVYLHSTTIHILLILHLEWMICTAHVLLLGKRETRMAFPIGSKILHNSDKHVLSPVWMALQNSSHDSICSLWLDHDFIPIYAGDE